jgi:hypothetical protein
MSKTLLRQRDWKICCTPYHDRLKICTDGEFWLPLWIDHVGIFLKIYHSNAYEGRAWRYQMGNQNPYIDEQTTQWPKEKVQKDKQRSTKHTYKTKDRVTRTALKTGCELRCSGRVGSSCSTSGTRRVNLVTNPVISRELGKDREVFTTSKVLSHMYKQMTQNRYVYRNNVINTLYINL